jgi:hypothetical protein
VNGNTNPALVSPLLDTNRNGIVSLFFTPGSTGTCVLSFNGSNAIVNAAIPFTVSLIESRVLSIAALSNSAVAVQLSGPANAHYYLQESDRISPALWKTVTSGPFATDGTATAIDSTSIGDTRFYRTLVVP